ncbi:hypothetical protein FH972_026184 [Carpinus fangiana]|uniref:Beta-glucuronidase C-terminal domain-containing protein n=1 Tax=Carpinus fangiana TaxID=176857 RepID=A0A5N6L3E1_9ROSI|nr:hypothetical protein FH972_026184 [Carpinus fangiana]
MVQSWHSMRDNTMSSLLRLPPQILLLIAAAVPSTHAQDAPSLSLRPNQTLADAGYDVSQIISPSFAGMGIEPSNLFSFTGGDEVNTMTDLRIGGNTQDYMSYDPSFTDFATKSNPNPRGQGAYASDSLIIGPGYLQALNRFPAGTPITYGLNLAYDEPDWRPRITELANASRSLLDHVKLVGFEIGNEPDLYLENGFRTGAWSGPVYTTQWLSRAAAVFEDVLQPNNISSNFFEPSCTASTIGTSFQISDLGQAGILQPANGSTDNKTYVATFNQHDYYYYIGVSSYALDLDLFQNLQETRNQFTAWVGQIQQAFALGVPYVLREMASVGPIGQQGISDTFGAALWTLDFFLYAATLNITSVQIHMTDNSFAAPWQPIDKYDMAPHVRPSYYAFAAMAQIIGAGCTTRVQTLPLPTVPAGYANRLVAYSIYRGDNIAGIVVINTMVSNSTDRSKGSIEINLSLPDHGNANFFVSSLLGPGTDATTNTTWNGLSFETGDFKPAAVGGASAAQQKALSRSGAARIQLRDASAIVISLDDALGTGPASVYDAQACQSLGSTRPEPESASGPDGTSSSQADASASAASAAGPDTTRIPNAPDAAGAGGMVVPLGVAVAAALVAGGWMA